jgi:hypothetical protein
MIKFGKEGKELPTIDFANTNMHIRSSSAYSASFNDLESSLTFYMLSEDFKKMDKNDIATQLNVYLSTTIGMKFLSSMSGASMDLKQRSSNGKKPISCKFYFNNLLLAIAVGVNSSDYGMNTTVQLSNLNPDDIDQTMQMLQTTINEAGNKHEELNLALHKEYMELGETISKQDLWKQKYMEEWVEYCKINLESKGLAWFKVKELAEYQNNGLLN